MSATIGKDLNTGMSTIKFDSTGRTVQFTPEESRDFTDKLRYIKAEGKIDKQSIGSQALYVLQLLGKAIEKGDPEDIATLWLGQGQKIVDSAVLNNMIEKVETPNPFGLYYISDNSAGDEERKLKAIKVSATIKNLVDELVRNISELEVESDYPETLSETAVEIKALYKEHVGVGDTVTDECIVSYFEKEIRKILGDCKPNDDEPSFIDNMVNDLYCEIH